MAEGYVWPLRQQVAVGPADRRQQVGVGPADRQKAQASQKDAVASGAVQYCAR